MESEILEWFIEYRPLVIEQARSVILFMLRTWLVGSFDIY